MADEDPRHAAVHAIETSTAALHDNATRAAIANIQGYQNLLRRSVKPILDVTKPFQRLFDIAKPFQRMNLPEVPEIRLPSIGTRESMESVRAAKERDARPHLEAAAAAKETAASVRELVRSSRAQARRQWTIAIVSILAGALVALGGRALISREPAHRDPPAAPATATRADAPLPVRLPDSARSE